MESLPTLQKDTLEIHGNTVPHVYGDHTFPSSKAIIERN